MDETPNTITLDLNSEPVDHLSPDYDLRLEPGESMSLEEYLERRLRRLREAIRHANDSRQEQPWRSEWGPHPTPPDDTRNIVLGLIGRSGLETGEGSVAPEERPTKTCDNNNGSLEEEALGKKEDVEKKGNGDEGSFFDCNICLDLARDPVVTCCGHLFCWPCLYRWLHIHSDAKECPICKGEVTTKNVTPIYGSRGNNTREPDEDLSLKIPLRPQARRIESWRQTIQRNAYTIPMEEMIRRLGSRFDLARDVVLSHQNPDTPRELPERSNSLLNRILTSRGMRREQNTVVESDNVVDLTHSSPTNSEVEESHRQQPRLHRSATLSTLMIESYFRDLPVERNQDQPPFDDRDSLSSIAAVIQSESQTVDTAVEIDSMVSHSTSSSRRRNDAPRVSDVDSGDSRALRRRRLNPN